MSALLSARSLLSSIVLCFIWFFAGCGVESFVTQAEIIDAGTGVPEDAVSCGEENGVTKYLICHVPDATGLRGCHSIPRLPTPTVTPTPTPTPTPTSTPSIDPQGITLCLPLPAILEGHLPHHSGDSWGRCQ